MASILIVEGDLTIAKLFASILSLQDWSADTCHNAAAALKVLNGSAAYDVIIVSYKLNGQNGLELIAAIRQLEHRKTTPVLMITGTPGIEFDALSAGASEVLYKPIELDELVRTVASHLP
ncbi:MAG TPA: response regulator [Blastocatellia bacterium]|nr:response regulator [Blastocatellia bacterium]